MELFWANGYEGTTLEDLLSAMGGITPPSFYHAFGSKEGLFKEAVDVYIRTVVLSSLQALEGAGTARAGVEGMLKGAVENFSRKGKPRGCLLLHGAMKCAPSSQGAQDLLQSIRVRSPDGLKKRLRRAVKEGDLPAGTDIARMAAFYTTVAQGLGVRAADGASRKELMAAVDGAMAAWDELAAPLAVLDRAPRARSPGRQRRAN